jgi:putative transcriptional regulator
MVDAKIIGERLAALRAKANKTGEEVSNACEISRSALTMYETGMRIPRDEVKIRLAKFYNTRVEDIFFA